MNRLVAAFSLALLPGTAQSPQAQNATATRAREPIVGLPCDACEAVLEGLPQSIASSSRIAPADEPGQAMRIEGTVLDRNGRTASGVIVYAYHTNARGIYPPDESLRGQTAFRHGRLRGWARTDREGRYRFETIRPGGYPESDIPAHVHMHVIEVGRCTYYIDEMLFEDDPRLTPEKRQQQTAGRGGGGVVVPARDASGTWVVTRDITLGQGIPEYPEGD